MKIFYTNDAETRGVIELDDGTERHIPIPPLDGASRRRYDAYLAAGNEVTMKPALAPTADDVRAEADRRLMLLLGVERRRDLDIKISNGTREAVTLLNKGEQNWTAEERNRSARLKQISARIDDIRAHSNRMEPDPPADYRADKHWPEIGE